MALNGANGLTLEEMKQFLRLTNGEKTLNDNTINRGFANIIKGFNDETIEQTIRMANLFLISNNTVRDLFINVTKLYFDAEVRNVNFNEDSEEIMNEVNEWVSNKTNDKIKSILSEPLPSDTIFAILNAVYFKGKWKMEFEKAFMITFYNHGVDKIEYNKMMEANQVFNFYASDELDAQLVEVEFKGNGTTFVIILPNAMDGLTKLKSQLNADNFKNALSSMNKERLILRMPEFKVEQTHNLRQAITPPLRAFTLSANFSRVSRIPGYISCAIQKVFVAIDRFGAEAAAVSAIIEVPMCGGCHFDIPQYRYVTVDHPFLYFIIDKRNDLILFMGQIDRLEQTLNDYIF